jgi:beta-glucanase (GH16 family)
MIAIASSAFLVGCVDRGRSFPDATSAARDIPGWRLVWADEFSKSKIDTTTWTAEVGNGANGWGNKEKEYYTARPANLSIVQNGEFSALKITARAESYAGFDYTSARIKTQGKKSARYGRIEARIKLPQGKGMWPAFWMMGESIVKVGWPACGEIDILEMAGGTNEASVSGTIHWKSASGVHEHERPVGRVYLDSGIFADDYHLFAVEWTDTSITWYMDTKQFFQASVSEKDREEFRDGMFFILLNVAVGGNFLGGQIPDPSFREQSMYVDYVRWYQR